MVHLPDADSNEPGDKVCVSISGTDFGCSSFMPKDSRCAKWHTFHFPDDKGKTQFHLCCQTTLPLPGTTHCRAKCISVVPKEMNCQELYKKKSFVHKRDLSVCSIYWRRIFSGGLPHPHSLFNPEVLYYNVHLTWPRHSSVETGASKRS